MLTYKARSLTPFFVAPTRGRQIVAGFSHLEHTLGQATSKSWLANCIESRHVEWAAIRQFDLLKESNDFYMEELDITDIKTSMIYWQGMRSHSYCVTVILLGYYLEDQGADDLQIMDEKIQQEITRMIQFLYLREQSDSVSALCDKALAQNLWDYRETLPHVADTLRADTLFRPDEATENKLLFFRLLEALPSSHIVHDVGVGLTLPEAEKNNRLNYTYEEEEKQLSFFNAIGSVMGEMIHHHMKGYRDELTTQRKPTHFKRPAHLVA